MASLELILIFALQIEASIGVIYLDYFPGLLLPCDGVSSSDRVCSTVSWFYSKDLLKTSDLVQNGNVVNSSVRAARLSLGTNCSLVINNITAEDAGFYTCRQRPELDIVMYLNITGELTGSRGPSGDGGRRGIGRFTYLYYTPGVNVILPCPRASSFDRDCSTVSWLYNRVQSQTSLEVLNGNVVRKSARAAKLRLDTNCSLVINNITPEDAGYYTCRKRQYDTGFFLNIMTILPSPPDADPKRDGKVTLVCSLLRFSKLPPCPPDSIRWLDETGTVLRGEGVGYEFIRQTNCVSVLTVKRQSGHNRRYTCQVVNERNKVQVEDDYTPVFTEVTSDDQPDKSNTGISVANIFLYYRPGDQAILPRDNGSSSDRVCSTVNWLYSRDLSQTLFVVQNGNVVKNSARAARMSLDTNCSLVINNITAEDAGRYTCRQAQKPPTNVFLSIMTILPSPPDADPKRDGNVTLVCSLLRFSKLPPCRLNSIRWLDETGTVLRGEVVGYKFIGQTNCVSVLTVKRQRGHNRRYTCQVLERKKVQLEDDYTPVFTEVTSDDQPDKSNTDWSPLDYVMLTLRIAGLLLITVIVVLLIKSRGNKTPPDENNVHDEGDEVNYENVEATSAA